MVVVGGTAGIGLAVAKAALEQGAELIVISSNQQRVDQTVAQLGANAQGHAANLTDEAQIQALFDQIGHFDHLVFTAGEALLLGEVAVTSLEAVRRAFELRYFGALAAVKYATSLIRPGGSIVLTTGIVSLRPGKGTSMARASVAPWTVLTRALAVELAPIRVNAV